MPYLPTVDRGVVNRRATYQAGRPHEPQSVQGVKLDRAEKLERTRGQGARPKRKGIGEAGNPFEPAPIDRNT